MPLFYLRQLTGSRRTETSNRHLARLLAFVAGAVNAGGFLAVRTYTSHMSGIVAAMADDLATGSLALVFNGFAAILSFVLGAFVTSLFIRWARSRELESLYALPLIAEALLLLLFGITGRVFVTQRVLSTVMLLCFTMGLQNAIITKISNSVIRTTHLTGMFTDIGIALGRIAFRVSDKTTGIAESIAPDVAALKLLGSLILLFFTGGVTGTFGFRYIGFFFTLPLSAILILLAAMPVVADMQRTTIAAPQ